MKNTQSSSFISEHARYPETPVKIQFDQSNVKKDLSTSSKKHSQNSSIKVGKNAWSKQEDELLRELILQYGAKNWTFIAQQFDQRGGKQCRERWHNHLRSGIRKEDWSQEEQWILALGVRAFGHKWARISGYLPGRTDNTIKNHWNCKMLPKKENFLFRINQIVENQQQSQGETLTEQMLLNHIRNNDAIEIGTNKKDKMAKIMSDRCQNAVNNFLKLEKMLKNN